MPAARAQSSPAQAARKALPPQVTGGALYVYTPWAKFCGKDRNDPAAALCLTVLKVRRSAGARVFVDRDAPAQRQVRLALEAILRPDRAALREQRRKGKREP
jgi:hypothetical protein